MNKQHNHHSAVAAAKSQSHLGHLRDVHKRFWVCLTLTIPVLLAMPMVQSLVGIRIAFLGDQLIILALTIIIFVYGGTPFFAGMRSELVDRRPGMMTLVGLALAVAYVYSIAVMAGLEGELLFGELVTLVDIMLLGHWIEMRSVAGASHALERLALFLPTVVHKQTAAGAWTDVDAQGLVAGDVVLVRPGEKISADGTVIEGESEIDAAALTGESVPVGVGLGGSVVAGTLNQSGALTIKVTKSQKDAYVTRVIKLIAVTMESKSRAQDLANRAAAGLTILALGVGALTFVIWAAWAGSLAKALEHSVTVMIAVCPHALGLAVPLVVSMVTGVAAQAGLLIRNRTAFEGARELDTIVFDKTGTLTTGTFEVTDVAPLAEWTEDKLLTRAAALEQYTKHSIAAAIVAHAQAKGLVLPVVTASTTIAGKGVRGTLDGDEVLVGNRALLEAMSSDGTAALEGTAQAQQQATAWAAEGKTAVFVATRNRVIGVIGLADAIRPESRLACDELRRLGLKLVMITGDNKNVAAAVGNALGIETVLAEVLPDQKAAMIERLRREGNKVAMVGDGINDAPALAAADVGMAIGAGTDVAIETADVILVRNDPRSVVDVIQLSRLTRRKMIQNLLWATVYNVLTMPVAAGALTGYGISMSPAVAAIAMSASAIIVVINARLISYYKQ